MEMVAADDSVGYSQQNRWLDTDADCSSLVIMSYQQAFEAMHMKGPKDYGATYTGNMRNAFLACGFEDVTNKVERTMGSLLERGDVLLNTLFHTALYCGNGQIVHASGDYDGRAGDSSGREICKRSYYNHPWNYVLRYTADEDSTITEVVDNDGGYEGVHGIVPDVPAYDSCTVPGQKQSAQVKVFYLQNGSTG